MKNKIILMLLTLILVLASCTRGINLKEDTNNPYVVSKIKLSNDNTKCYYIISSHQNMSSTINELTYIGDMGEYNVGDTIIFKMFKK